MPEPILVADDDPANRDLLEAVLTEAGYPVRLAEDGAAALVRVHQDPPALVLLDLLMPVMGGLELCRALKRDRATADIPVLVVTAYAEPQERERILTRGADDVLAKPIEPRDALARVRALLAVRHIRQPLERTLAYLTALEAERRGLPQAGAARIPILLVDDEPLPRQLFGELLHEQGFAVHTAADGAAALRVLDRVPVEAVLLDLVMPRMPGLELLARIRARDPQLPVIVLTAQASSEHAVAALKLGASDFITKGCVPGQVALAVHRAIRQRRARRAGDRAGAALGT
jgi:DNA-binding response OmpR family regulator